MDKEDLMGRCTLAGSLLLLVAVSLGIAGDRQPVYRTPQEVFEAARKALQREDIKGLCATLTDDWRDTLAGRFVLMYGLMKAFSMRESEEKQWEFMAKFKPLDDVLAKHGLMEKAPNKTKEAKPAGNSPEAFAQVLKELVAPVKDRSAFMVDVVAFFNKLDEKKSEIKVSDWFFDLRGELKELKVVGDMARGVVVRKKGGQENREAIWFSKVGRGWKIEKLVPLNPEKGVTGPLLGTIE
jgi:hypothetical protein